MTRGLLSNTTLHWFVAVLNVPRLKPIVCVASGPTDVSVAVTAPPVWATNEKTFALTGYSSPENVSAVGNGVPTMGVVVVVPQPLANAISAASPRPQAIRRSIPSPTPNDRLLDFQWPGLV